MNYFKYGFIIFIVFSCSEFKARKDYVIENTFFDKNIKHETAIKLVNYAKSCKDLSCLPIKEDCGEEENLDYFHNYKIINHIIYESKNKGSKFQITVSQHYGDYLMFTVHCDKNENIVFDNCGTGII